MPDDTPNGSAAVPEVDFDELAPPRRRRRAADAAARPPDDGPPDDRGRPARPRSPSATSTSRWPSGCRPTSRTSASARIKQQQEAAAAGAARLVESLLPVLDACDNAIIHGAADVAPIHKSLLRDADQGRPRGRRRPTACRSTPTCTRPCSTSPATAASPHDRRGAAHRLPVEGQRAARRHGEGQGLGAAPMAPQREWFEKDYYAVLGVAESASAKEIKSAYRKLSRQFHPDANAGDASAEERFKEISAAYDVLGDEAKRKEYDEVRRLGPMGNPLRRWRRARWLPLHRRRVGDLGDLFGGLFSRGRGRAPGAGRPPGSTGPQRGADLESELQLSFEGAASGVETTVNLTSDVACSTCHGSGAKPGTTPAGVPGVRRPRRDERGPGLLQLQRAVPELPGPGLPVDDPCPTCRGTGAERKARQVKVRIPAGVKDGQRIRLAGRGAPGRNGGPTGDLYVVVRVAGHPLFGRKGDDLTITVPITFPEAALGAEIAVPTLDGPPVTIKVPGGHAVGPDLPRAGQGHRHRQAHRRPLGHRRGRRSCEAVAGGAQGRGGARRQRHRVAPDPSGSVSVDGEPRSRAGPGGVRDLRRRRARRGPPADAAHLRAQGPRRSGPHRRRQPPLQRGRHRPAAPHPGADERRA